MFHGTTDDTLGRGATLLGRPAEARRLTAAALATYERIGAAWWRDRLVRRAPAREGGPAAVAVRLHQQPGGLWTVGRPGAEITLPDLRGLHHLYALLSRPGVPVPALALVGAVPAGGLEVLDEQARRAYRARLHRIEAELDEAADLADLGRRERLEDERQALLDQLDRATGLGGRRRVTGSSEERARVAVRKALVAALARIAEADPWLGRHLRDRLRTGTECVYETDPDHPVRWLLRA
jgi:hypothetical protein